MHEKVVEPYAQLICMIGRLSFAKEVDFVLTPGHGRGGAQVIHDGDIVSWDNLSRTYNTCFVIIYSFTVNDTEGRLVEGD